MSPPLPKLFPTYPHPNAFETLLPHLLPFLPSSLPLVRRLQYHTSSPHATAFATFPPKPSPRETSHFASCWIDRTRGPETECWIFSTHELHSKLEIGEQDASTARAQLLALLLAIAAAPNPLDKPPLIVIGSVHASLLPLLASGEGFPEVGAVVSRELPKRDKGGGGDGGRSVLGAVSSAYVKWLIPPCPPPVATSKKGEGMEILPAGYTFSQIRRDELARVVASTSIPRTEKTLAELANACVRDQVGRAVSWGFLGVDGSLSSLYTEEQHRGKGLAKAVSRVLLEQLAGGGNEGEGQKRLNMGDGEGWMHSDIDFANNESAAVVRAIGGRVGWQCRWISVDMRRVRNVVSQTDG